MITAAASLSVTDRVEESRWVMFKKIKKNSIIKKVFIALLSEAISLICTVKKKKN